ncbi:MAG: 2-amino-4-hydroxy-6-hydroxymethyldihydropteridine diphosphokinase, partial [Proteobacteria bacterium]|nr:2-amino-4-hydroxy-6-hydroxymethyldihydropteridine diphosphokinase [Pseudomonadota bacterium]
RWGPRVIDIDILLYDDLILSEKELKIPHPEMKERIFVMVPLSEIGYNVLHPLTGKTIGEMASGLSGLESIKKWE